MHSLLEQTRLTVSRVTAAQTKAELGQFLTPERTAQFMAGLFTLPSGERISLLDPGAGIGSLTNAFIERISNSVVTHGLLDITAFEIDPSLRIELERTVSAADLETVGQVTIEGADFIEAAVSLIKQQKGGGFTHAILNPPYKKIASDSRHRQALREVGIETVNLYSAFMALTILLLVPGGQMVAIVPRSFCNGPYYRPFRELLLTETAIRHIHLFSARDKAFRDDGVLQENVIFHVERKATQGLVAISTSKDDSFGELDTLHVPFDKVVLPRDPEQFIHIPTTGDQDALELASTIRFSLADLGLEVSTGPVVDFRLKAHLRGKPELGTVPLLYPTHFSGQETEWPKLEGKKPNSIVRNIETERWLYPTGWYCVVRRFSSKEERRRIVASVVMPSGWGDATKLGFENHLNVFHHGRRGLQENLVRGLAIYLNSTVVDAHFRRFNGHTQVNATDLRNMRYPSRDTLEKAGQHARHIRLDQANIDLLVKEFFLP